MSESAFIVRIPEAEPWVADLRNRHDVSAKLGVPAHVTVLFPFMGSDRISQAVLALAQRALNEVAAFTFSFSEVRRFPATAYLAPEQPDPFIALTAALVRAFPDFPPFRGEHESVVPHLTVANGDASDAAKAADELRAILRVRGPISGFCSNVTLIENLSGLWKEMHDFKLSHVNR